VKGQPDHARSERRTRSNVEYGAVGPNRCTGNLTFQPQETRCHRCGLVQPGAKPMPVDENAGKRNPKAG
jgi:hypothetical protein